MAPAVHLRRQFLANSASSTDDTRNGRWAAPWLRLVGDARVAVLPSNSGSAARPRWGAATVSLERLGLLAGGIDGPRKTRHAKSPFKKPKRRLAPRTEAETAWASATATTFLRRFSHQIEQLVCGQIVPGRSKNRKTDVMPVGCAYLKPKKMRGSFRVIVVMAGLQTHGRAEAVRGADQAGWLHRKQ